VHVEDPVRSRHDLENADRALPLLENPYRQTGGIRSSASGNAVLDSHMVAFGHRADSLRWISRASFDQPERRRGDWGSP
jgi:hypothetical protein